MDEGEREQEARLSCEIAGVSVALSASDLSQAGLFVSGAVLAADAEVEVLLRSPIGGVRLRGQVVQVISRERASNEGRPAGCGLLFMDLEDDQRAWISLTLDALARAEQKAQASVAARSVVTSHSAAARAAPGGGGSNESRGVAPHASGSVGSTGDSSPSDDSALSSLGSEMSTSSASCESASTQAATSTLRELEQQLAAVRDKLPWEVLGIDAGAGPDAAHDAFLLCSKRCHPHVFARFDSPAVSRAATELFIAHRRAYATISKGSLRPPANAPPVQPPKTPSVTQATKAPSGASASKTPSITQPPKTPSVIRASKTPSVTQAPKTPAVVKPAKTPSLMGASIPPAKRQAADAEILVQSGVKHLAASRFEEAAKDLERALRIWPVSRDADLWLRICRARKLKAEGKGEEAARAYSEVLELDPEHREAREYLQPAVRRSGLIGKWFGNEGR